MPATPTPHTSTSPRGSLTDRYVEVALRGTHADQHSDLDLELRGLIEDGIEASIAAGADPADAEFATLTELGDPARLSDRYRGRTAQLIGPALYYQWLALLKILLAVIVPILSAVTAFGAVANGDDAIGLLTTTIGAAVATAIQVTFWVTVVFAALERFVPSASAPSPARTDDWTPDDLPELPDSAAGIGETAWSVAMSVFVIAAMFWQRGSTILTDDGRPVPILDPEGWAFWWPLVIALLIAEAVVVLVAFRRHRWTPPLFAAFAAVQVAFAAVVLWLIGNDELLNPAFVDLIDWGDVGSPGQILTAAIAVSVVATSLWDIVEKARATWPRR